MDKDHNKRRTTLISFFSKNRFSKDTEEKVQKWLIEEEHTEEKRMASEKYWNTLDIPTDETARQALQRINRKRGIPLQTATRSSLFYFSRIAAILLPLLVISGFWLYTRQQAEWITIAVANGETREIQLPDGSQIWLNGGSSFRYPNRFTKNKRNVWLAGEGWFSVQADPEHPFRVETPSVTIQVVGTTFNLKAYNPEEMATITLATGKVEVITPDGEKKELNPLQQLSYDQTKSIRIKDINENGVDPWREQLIFEDSSPEEILRTLERRYDLVFNTETDPAALGERYTVKFYRNDSIDDILNVLSELIDGLSFRKESNQVTVSPDRGEKS